jgi:hypothetical protein
LVVSANAKFLETTFPIVARSCLGLTLGSALRSNLGALAQPRLDLATDDVIHLTEVSVGDEVAQVEFADVVVVERLEEQLSTHVIAGLNEQHEGVGRHGHEGPTNRVLIVDHTGGEDDEDARLGGAVGDVGGVAQYRGQIGRVADLRLAELAELHVVAVGQVHHFRAECPDGHHVVGVPPVGGTDGLQQLGVDVPVAPGLVGRSGVGGVDVDFDAHVVDTTGCRVRIGRGDLLGLLGERQTGGHRDDQDTDDDAQVGERRRVGQPRGLVPADQLLPQVLLHQRVAVDHLDADVDQDEADALVQLADLPLQVGVQEEQVPQTEDGHHVGHEGDEETGRDAEDDRDGVDGEDQVRHLHEEDDEHESRGDPADLALVVGLGDELVAIEAVDGRHQLLEQLVGHAAFDVGLLLGLHFRLGQVLVVLVVLERLGTLEDQEEPHEEQDPADLGQDRHAEQDGEEAHGERADDTPQQHFVPVGSRHGHAAQDHRDDEQVVDAEHQLRQVGTAVLDEALAAEIGAEAHDHAERERQADAGQRHDDVGAQARLDMLAVALAIHPEVDGQERDDHEDRQCPRPESDAGERRDAGGTVPFSGEYCGIHSSVSFRDMMDGR